VNAQHRSVPLDAGLDEVVLAFEGQVAEGEQVVRGAAVNSVLDSLRVPLRNKPLIVPDWQLVVAQSVYLEVWGFSFFDEFLKKWNRIGEVLVVEEVMGLCNEGMG
jgi:hypothetical protein